MTHKNQFVVHVSSVKSFTLQHFFVQHRCERVKKKDMRYVACAVNDMMCALEHPAENCSWILLHIMTR